MKSNVKGYIILAVLFILVSLLALVIPSEKTAVFWISYVFTMIAFALQIIIWKTVIGHDKSLKSKFLKLPIINIGIIYLVVQVVAFIVFTLAPTLPAWSAVVVCGLVFGVSVVCMISSDIGSNEIERIEEKVQKNRFYLKSLQVDVELIASRESDGEVKAKLLKLAENLRFSDPMSDARLTDLEEEIADKIGMLKSSDDKLTAIAEIDQMLTERNTKIKILK